ncbi:MAG TPA: hypothetical protein VD794_08330 [Flavisolibacter sp.]|nr:hypothetical protein [Flavisolibacter sp.]
MKRFYIISGLVIIVVVCFTINRKKAELDVFLNGRNVSVTLTDLPKSIGAKVRYPIRFTYLGKEYSKLTRGAYSEEHYLGEKATMRHKDEYEDLFLFTHENMYVEVVSMVALLLFGVFLIVYGYRKG